MAQATLEDFIPRYPEFNCVEPSIINATLVDAQLYTDGSWGDAEFLGSMLYTAHSLVMRGLGDGAASAAFKNSHIKSRSSGSHKVEYNAPSSASDDPYLSTHYGKQFAQLRDSLSPGIISVR